MAKNIVKVNEEEIRGYMVGNIPDAIEKEDVIVVEVPAEKPIKGRIRKRKQPRKIPNLTQSVKVKAVSVRSIW